MWIPRSYASSVSSVLQPFVPVPPIESACRLTSLGLGCENISIVTCHCRPAPLQLIELGLFGSAPVAPQLAVDIQVLQFCRQSFLRLPPNVTGWSEATKAFLHLQGIQFKTRVRSCTILSRWQTIIAIHTTKVFLTLCNTLHLGLHCNTKLPILLCLIRQFIKN